MPTQQIERIPLVIPPVFAPLGKPARYKGAFGGRGSGKSWAFADLLIARCGSQLGTRWLCVREIQKSLLQSAKRLVEAELERHGIGESDGFRVLNERIETPGGGVIVFVGMQDHTADSLKSYEGFDGAWVEEAQTLSERSLTLLRPTIRKENSELWFSWNPRRKQDPVDAMLRGPEPPTGSVVVQANWRDNPWFPAVLEQERRDCLRANPDEYAHIWEGDYITLAKGAYYAKHLTAARAEGRIGRVPADPLMTYRVFVDIGGTGAKADAFAMWVAQFVGQEIRILDYYEAQGQELAAHVSWLRERGYTPGKASVWLPHDGGTNDRVFNVSYQSAFQQAGYTVTVVPNQGAGAAKSRIEAARRLFPAMWFNESTTTAGVEAIGWYHPKIDEARGIDLGPEHDWASHGADAFGLMAVAYKSPVGQGSYASGTSGPDYGPIG